MIPGGRSIFFAQANDFSHDVFRLCWHHNERSQSSNVVDIVEPHNGEVRRTSVQLDHKFIRRHGDYLSDGASLVVVAHEKFSSSPSGSLPRAINSRSTRSTAVSTLSPGASGMNLSTNISK